MPPKVAPKGRGAAAAVGVAPPAGPERLAICCGGILAQLPAHVYADSVAGGVCRRCGWFVHEHPADRVAAAPQELLPAAAAGARQGPPLVAPRDEARAFRLMLEVWKGHGVLSRDRAQWVAAFETFERVVYDGTSWNVVDDLFIVNAEHAGMMNLTREWRFRPACEDRPRHLLRLEALMTAARAVLEILKMQLKSDYFMKGVYSRVMKVEYELPVAVWVAELILSKKTFAIPGVFPYGDFQARDYLHPLWWAIEIAVTPFEDFQVRIPQLFILAVERWSTTNGAQLTDWAVWKTKIPKKRGAEAAGADALASSPAKKEQRLSKSARKKAAAGRRAADGGGDDYSGETERPAEAAAAGAEAGQGVQHPGQGEAGRSDNDGGGGGRGFGGSRGGAARGGGGRFAGNGGRYAGGGRGRGRW